MPFRPLLGRVPNRRPKLYAACRCEWVMTIGGDQPTSPPCVFRAPGAAIYSSSSSTSGIGRIRWSFINGASESATSNAFRPARVNT